MHSSFIILVLIQRIGRAAKQIAQPVNLGLSSRQALLDEQRLVWVIMRFPAFLAERPIVGRRKAVKIVNRIAGRAGLYIGHIVHVERPEYRLGTTATCHPDVARDL
jgi:hypothetical protein